MNRTSRYALFAVLLLGLTVALIVASRQGRTPEPIQIGVLHSLTGTMAVSERPVVDAVTLAVEEINAGGGLLGRPVVTRIADGASEPERFAEQAEWLIRERGVAALFGCWTSSSRKAVKPVVEKHDHLLFYPLQYEGLEHSPNIIYTGAAPNQQIIPAVHWAIKNLGPRVYVVGSDYIFPRAAGVIIRDLLRTHDGRLLGERYYPLGATDLGAVAEEIARLKPDVVFNTVNGDSNLHLLRALAAAGVDAAEVPLLSFSLGEGELDAFEGVDAVGQLAAWSYFESIDGEENRRFVQRFRQRFGEDRVIGDPMASAYVAVRLWAQAVRESGTLKPAAVRRALGRQSLVAPEGIVSVDPGTLHLWKHARIGRYSERGRFEILWSSGHAVRPEPFPSYRSPREWRERIESLPGQGVGALDMLMPMLPDGE